MSHPKTLDDLITILKARMTSAYGWMEGADCDSFYRYEGEFCAYAEAWNLARRLRGDAGLPAPKIEDLEL